MTVLGRTVGFMLVGPKRDRTQYLREEVETLAVLAHRVGTVYWLLQRAETPLQSANALTA